MYGSGLRRLPWLRLWRFVRLPSLDADKLFHPAQQILLRADLTIILRLKIGELLRQLVSVHVPVYGDQPLSGVGLHQIQEALPFIPHPFRLQIGGAGAHHQHNPGGVQRREDIRLIRFAQLIFQRDARKEHMMPPRGQRVVNLLRVYAVGRAPAVFICFLVADKRVKGLFLAGDGKEAVLNHADPPGLALVQLLRGRVRKRGRAQIVHILQHRFRLHTVQCRQLLAAVWVLHIFDAIVAQHRAPVGLGVFRPFQGDGLIGQLGLIKVLLHALLVRAVVKRGHPLVVHLRKRRIAAAVFTSDAGFPLPHRDAAAAHFAFEYHETGISFHPHLRN